MSTTQPTKNTLKTVWHTFISSSAWRWFQKAIVLIIFSLVVNHLATRDSFPDSESYRFPIEGFLSTIVLFILIGIIAILILNFTRKSISLKR